MPLYFAYGSNMSSDQMNRRCCSARKVGLARLCGSRVVFSGSSKRWGGGVADLAEDSDSMVWGVLWDLSDEDLTNLDRCEGVDSRVYIRCEKAVLDEEGNRLMVHVYRRPDPLPATAPSSEYAQTILDGAQQNNLPGDYQEKLRQWIRDAGCSAAGR